MLDQADSAFDFYFARPTNTLLRGQANFNRGHNRPCRVGTYEPNVLGLWDMHGNVWEWCDDTEIAANGNSIRAGRGGSWHDHSGECLATSRPTWTPSHREKILGLRLARVPSGAPSPAAKTPPLAVAPFTDADVKRIAALPAAEQVEEVRKELMRRNPGFDGKVGHKIENEVVTELSFNTDRVDNIAPVRALTGLVYLDCRGTYPNKGKLSDLSPLKGMTLSRLDCSSTQVSELTALAGLPLTYLHFNHNPVADLTPLKGMPMLELGLAETKVSDLSPLKGMKLRMLGAQLVPVTDLSPLEGMPLTGLDLYGTRGVTNLAPLKGMPLEGLNLQDVPVSDLSPLQGMESLRTLLLMGNAVSDLTPLQGLKLTTLILRDKQISDLSPLKGMPLVRLEIYGTGVTDLRPLQGMKLGEFRFTPKSITQGLNLLRDMPSLKTIGIDSNQAWPAAEFWKRYGKGEFKVGFAPFTDADVKRIAALPAAEQVEEVRKELVRRNPGFDGKVEHKIEDGVVTEIKVVTENVTDISPIRVFNSLRVLDCAGTAFQPETGRLSDLTPLKGMNLAGLTHLGLHWTQVGDAGLAHFKDCKKLTRLHIEKTEITDLSLLKGMPLKELDCDFQPERDAEILRSITTLETINGKPAAEFWKDVEKK